VRHVHLENSRSLSPWPLVSSCAGKGLSIQRPGSSIILIEKAGLCSVVHARKRELATDARKGAYLLHNIKDRGNENDRDSISDIYTKAPHEVDRSSAARTISLFLARLVGGVSLNLGMATANNWTSIRNS
jgi:hypothetical protein